MFGLFNTVTKQISDLRKHLTARNACAVYSGLTALVVFNQMLNDPKADQVEYKFDIMIHLLSTVQLMFQIPSPQLQLLTVFLNLDRGLDAVMKSAIELKSTIPTVANFVDGFINHPWLLYELHKLSLEMIKAEQVNAKTGPNETIDEPKAPEGPVLRRRVAK